jgi:hypothetical protein
LLQGDFQNLSSLPKRGGRGKFQRVKWAIRPTQTHSIPLCKKGFYFHFAGGEAREVMEKELCLKFLVHLYKFSSAILKKPHIDEVDITYINNEVENFLKRIDPGVAKHYDKLGALGKIGKIKQETKTDQAANLAKFLLKLKFKWLEIFMGHKNDAHVQRHRKISEFNETVKKVVGVVEYS